MTELPRTARLRGLAEGDTLPAWLTSALYGVLVWCASAGIIALFLLGADRYGAPACSLLATAATAATWRFRPRRAAGDHAAHGPAIAAVGIALVLLAMAGAGHSEHLFNDRDPAVYINSGRSIARTHRLNPKVAPGPFDDKTAFSGAGAGANVEKDHRVHFNFLAFLPALLALGWSAGGDTGLLLVPALLGALALLTVYALGTTVVGPRWALLAPAILTLAPLQSWFARDAYTELPLQLLGLGGIWLLIEALGASRRTAGAVAGVVLGTVTFVRIDGLAVLIGIPAALVIEHLRAAAAPRPARAQRRATISWFAAAVAVTALAGLAMSRALSPAYLHDLRDELRELELAIVVGVAGALAIGRLHRVRPGIGSRLARNQRVFRSGAALTGAAALYAYVWRPAGSKPSGSTHQPGWIRALNSYYFSFSFRWFAWYLGIFTLVLAVLGFIALARRALRADLPVSILLAASVPVAVLYIARPSISPDHLWAMRRYLPVVLPAMIIAATAAAIWATSKLAVWRSGLRAPIVVVFAGAMLIPPAIVGLPLAGAQMQGGSLAAIHTICSAAGRDAAIAVTPYAYMGAELPQALRSFCGVPAEALVVNQPTPLTDFAREWQQSGHRFYVVTTSRNLVTTTAPAAVEVAHVVVHDAREPERTATRAPRHYAPRPVELWLYRVDPG